MSSHHCPSIVLLFLNQVEQEENLAFLLEYLAQFCERLPTDIECEDCLDLPNLRVAVGGVVLSLLSILPCQFIQPAS